VEAVVRPILDRGDPADDHAVTSRQEQLPVGVGVEGIRRSVQRVVHGHAKRRHPLRKSPPIEQPPWQVDEATEIAASCDGDDVDGHGSGWRSAYASRRRM
jgi:hypothetical protein